MNPNRVVCWHGAQLLTPGGVVPGDLYISRGRIAAVIEHGGITPSRFTATVHISMDRLLLVPGFINCHDHLDFNCFPRYGPGRPYANVRQWSADVQGAAFSQIRTAVQDLPLRHRIRAGIWKNILSGVTTLVHHNPKLTAFQLRRTPLTVIQPSAYCHSLEFGPDPARNVRGAEPGLWIIHAGEGTDEAARSEVSRLAAMGCLGANTLLVHCIAIDGEKDRQVLEDTGSSIIWCPSSNLFLFGRTAPVPRIIGSIRVGLGTDSMISGEGGMLDELRMARRTYPDMTSNRILKMCTSDAAVITGQTQRLGRLKCGLAADFAAYEISGNAGADPREDVFRARHPALLVRRGSPVFSDAGRKDLFRALGLKTAEFRYHDAELVMEASLCADFRKTVHATCDWPPFAGEVEWN